MKRRELFVSIFFKRRVQLKQVYNWYENVFNIKIQ